MSKIPTSAEQSEMISDEDRAIGLLKSLARKTALQSRLKQLSKQRKLNARLWPRVLQVATGIGLIVLGYFSLSEWTVHRSTESYNPEALDRALPYRWVGLFQILAGCTTLLIFYVESRSVKHDHLVIESLLALEPKES